jgi:undecaprenyl-diphosphatase
VAIAFAVAMAFTRTYLRVHWLSDVVAGSLLGTSVGLACVAAVESARATRRHPRRRWSSDGIATPRRE